MLYYASKFEFDKFHWKIHSTACTETSSRTGWRLWWRVSGSMTRRRPSNGRQRGEMCPREREGKGGGVGRGAMFSMLGACNDDPEKGSSEPKARYRLPWALESHAHVESTASWSRRDSKRSSLYSLCSCHISRSSCPSPTPFRPSLRRPHPNLYPHKRMP